LRKTTKDFSKLKRIHKKGSKRPDLTGLSYEYWEILEYVGNFPVNDNGYIKYREIFYNCKCVCGTIRFVQAQGNKLTSKSCGCQNIGRTGQFLPENQIDKYAAIRSNYKTDAKNRNYVWNLSNEEFDKLIVSKCFYCGSQKQTKRAYNNWGIIEFTGIDRVDNSIGYVLSNCVPCCKQCNFIKKACSKEIIYKAYNFLFGDKNV